MRALGCTDLGSASGARKADEVAAVGADELAEVEVQERGRCSGQSKFNHAVRADPFRRRPAR